MEAKGILLTHPARPALPWFQNQTKTAQRNHRAMSHEHSCRNPQRDVSVSNPATCENHTPQQSGNYSRCVRLVQHEINWCNPSDQQAAEETTWPSQQMQKGHLTKSSTVSWWELSKLGWEGHVLTEVRNTRRSFQLTSTTCWELQSFPTEIRNEARKSPSPVHFNIVLEDLAKTRQKQSKAYRSRWKKRNELMSSYSKVAGHEVTTQ